MSKNQKIIRTLIDTNPQQSYNRKLHLYGLKRSSKTTNF